MFSFKRKPINSLGEFIYESMKNLNLLLTRSKFSVQLSPVGRIVVLAIFAFIGEHFLFF